MRDTSTKKVFGLLLPGLRDLLRREASNGLGERVFGLLSRRLSKFNKETNAELYLGMRVTTKYIPCEGFSAPVWEDAPPEDAEQIFECRFWEQIHDQEDP